MTKRIIRLPQVQSMVGLAKATIYLKMKQGSFPKNFKIGERACAWLQSDIEQWIDEACSKV